MTEFISFFIVLLAAVFFSALFNRLHLPWVVALLIAGIAIGPYGLEIFTPSPAIELLGQVGLIFLMFMAGLETRVSSVRSHLKQIGVISLANGLVPFVVGASIALVLGWEVQSALLLGIIFISTSIAVVVPAFEANGLFHAPVGNAVVAATIIEDVVSLLALSLLLQIARPVTALPLYYFYPILLMILLVLRWSIPRIRLLATASSRGADLFQQETRLVFVLLLGVVVIFELLGLHPIIAGFFAGIVLSKSITSRVLKEKLRAISYGVFIPIFFILIGTKTDLSVLFAAREMLLMATAIIVGSVGSKFFSGWMAARAVGFSKQESSLLGVATIPSLTTTLAVAFTGLEFGLLDQTAVTVLVLLSIITTFVGPLAINLLARRIPRTTQMHVR